MLTDYFWNIIYEIPLRTRIKKLSREYTDMAVEDLNQYIFSVSFISWNLWNPSGASLHFKSVWMPKVFDASQKQFSFFLSYTAAKNLSVMGRLLLRIQVSQENISFKGSKLNVRKLSFRLLNLVVSKLWFLDFLF